MSVWKKLIIGSFLIFTFIGMQVYAQTTINLPSLDDCPKFIKGLSGSIAIASQSNQEMKQSGSYLFTYTDKANAVKFQKTLDYLPDSFTENANETVFVVAKIALDFGSESMAHHRISIYTSSGIEKQLPGLPFSLDVSQDMSKILVRVVEGNQLKIRLYDFNGSMLKEILDEIPFLGVSQIFGEDFDGYGFSATGDLIHNYGGIEKYQQYQIDSDASLSMRPIDKQYVSVFSHSKDKRFALVDDGLLLIYWDIQQPKVAAAPTKSRGFYEGLSSMSKDGLSIIADVSHGGSDWISVDTTAKEKVIVRYNFRPIIEPKVSTLKLGMDVIVQTILGLPAVPDYTEAEWAAIMPKFKLELIGNEAYLVGQVGDFPTIVPVSNATTMRKSFFKVPKGYRFSEDRTFAWKLECGSLSKIPVVLPY